MTQPLLHGTSVVVTRAKTQASVLGDKLEQLGATTLSVATIEIVPPRDGGAALTDAIERVGDYAQVVVASPNGARVLGAAAAATDPDRLPPVACVGPSTAAKLQGSPWRVNVVADRAVSEGLVEAMPAARPDERLLLVQAEIAREVLYHGLAAKGWNVDRVVAYRTIDAEISDADRANARMGDVITFTSSSTVERFVRLVGLDAIPPVVASIGPITSETARNLGVKVDIEADPHTIDGLVAAIAEWASA